MRNMFPQNKYDTKKEFNYDTLRDKMFTKTHPTQLTSSFFVPL